MIPSYLSFLKQREPTIRILFYASWLIINLIQAGLTNLIYDEAYYWVCSREIDWGHFYAPPFIDLLIQAGYAAFQSELGVRLFFVLMGTAGIFLLEKLLIRDDLLLYYAVLSSLVFMQVIGILAAPDIPLFFFTISFYLLFRKLIEKESLPVIILLAINTALLLYTKYHGLMIILFTFFANLRFLLRKWRTYLWILLAVLLFIPHIIWQFRHGFPTIVFHLFERPGGGPFELRNLLDYIPGQILFAGPFISIIMIIALFRFKPENRFERTLFFNLLAMYGFFFLISFYHHIEMNWTVIGIPPLIILSHKVMSDNIKFQKWVYPIVIPSVVVALVFRMILIFPEQIPVTRIRNELSGHAEWAASIKKSAGDLPVVFISRYQPASIYSFYSGGDKTYTLNPGQKSDFDLFGYEEQLQGKSVYMVAGWKLNASSDTIDTGKGVLFGTKVENFRSYKRIKLEVRQEESASPDRNEKKFLVKWINPYPYDITFVENPSIHSSLGFRLYKDNELIKQNEAIMPAEEIPFNRTIEISIRIENPVDYELQFFLKTGYDLPHPVSRIIKLDV